MSQARAVFVDRDGVINQLRPDPVTGLPESPLRSNEIVLVTGAAAALSAFAAAGWLLVGVSNQPAAAKGTVSVEQLDAVHERVVELLSSRAARFDAFKFCLHHPDGLDPDLTVECDCRKPAPGMLLEAAAELDIDLGQSWMIGDTDADVLAGIAAGCRTVLVEYPGSAHKRSGSLNPDVVVSGLCGAAAAILSPDRVS